MIKPIRVKIFAGKSVLSDKIAVDILPDDTPLGVCTSAGTVGPSLSLGKADAVVIACKSTPIADAFATSIANKIVTESDINTVIAQTDKHKDILSAIIIKNDKVGIKGKFKPVFIK